MPMITKPASIEKNSAAQITLDKTVLAAVASVEADTYFGDSTNWSEVLIYFKSSEGNQREILKFDATQASPTANFLVSDKARDAFEVQKIVIKDFDNDSFTVTRSELVVADFDVMLGGGGSGESLLYSQELINLQLINTNAATNNAGQSFTPDVNFTLTGLELYAVFSNAPSDITLVVNVKDVSDQIVGTGSVNMGMNPDGWFRVDFSNIPMIASSFYFFEVKTNTSDTIVIKGTSSSSFNYGVAFSSGSPLNSYDLGIKIYGV